MREPVVFEDDLLRILDRKSLRGRLLSDVSLSDYTWLRVGGPAKLLYTPADEDDLAAFLRQCPSKLPLTVIGVGSNLIVRDGGVPGVVIRLGKGFNEARISEDHRINAGAAMPDVRLSQVAAAAEIAGLEFYRGIPGTVGGALKMNAGAHGRETKNVVINARAMDRQGNIYKFEARQIGFKYRGNALAEELIFLDATFQGHPGNRAQIERDMQEVANYREANQPIKSRTGGSTFKNPPGHSAWKLIDAAGCRGLRVGGAHMSEMHCNFLINDGHATANDVETLGELVRERVLAHSGILLEWEIKRIGVAA